MRCPVLTCLLLTSLMPSAVAAEAPEPDTAIGIRQVQEGDFEGAVVTLQAVARKLEGQTARRLELAQAHLYLGIAHVALDQPDLAKTAFRAALGHNKSLRLTPERFSPKVIAAFEEARREAEGTPSGGTARAKSGGKPLFWVAVGGAAAGAVALAARAGGDDGTLTMANARFATPMIVCQDGSVDVMLPFSILVDADNGTDRIVTLQSVSTVAVVTDSDFRSEIGFSSNMPSVVAPASVPARGRATLRVDTSLLCGNGAGGPARSNTWLARLSFNTSAGVFNLETAGRMRVDLP